MIESERDLQDYFLKLLENNSFNFINLKNEENLISNFKRQFELFNNTYLSDDEFLDIYNSLVNEPSFDKLRYGHETFSFIDFDNFRNNNFQVSEEITVKSDYTNRFDVTILVNGIPLIQVELKKPGVDLKEAFNQIKRYDAHTYQGLFSYVHLFIISNNVNTRFFFNNHDFNYDYSFNWHDFLHLDEFTNAFLTIDNLSIFFKDYIFKNPIDKQYYMLRPYQIDAIDKVKSNIDIGENGYLWMTYGSGLNLTSLQLAYILSNDYKVVYVTSNSLSYYPKRFLAKNKKQFLNKFKHKNIVISHIRNIISNIDEICDEKVIYIFNDYEKLYKKYNPLILKNKCKNSLFYLFSHAPIFNENIVLDKTSKYIFDNHIFTYNLNDAFLDKIISDINIEIYESCDDLSQYNLSSSLRLNAVSDIILKNINSASILIASSNEDLISYYNIFNDFNIKVAPIFRFNSNDNILNLPAQDIFEKIVDNYNKDFNTTIPYRYQVNNHTTRNKLEDNIIKKFNNGEIDLLIIDESMFNDVFNINVIRNLNNHSLNSIFLDCNLKYESLLQVSSLGNIYSFRDIRRDINQSLKLFANDAPEEDYEFKNYNHYLNEYAHYLYKLKDSKGDFIENFNKLNENYLILQSFDEYDLDEEKINEFNQFKDQYDHIIYEIESSKKEITQYDIGLLYKFTIDLNYINTIKKGESPEIIEITLNHEEKYMDEVPIEEETLPDEDNSSKEDSSIKFDEESLVKKNNVNNSLDRLRDDIMPSKNDFIKSIRTDFNLKVCPECGREYKSDANFCDSCKELIHLVYKNVLVKKCPCCGAKYPNDYNFCIKCHCDDALINEPQINIKEIESYPNNYYNVLGHSNKFGSIDDLLNENNLSKLQNTILDYEAYEMILSKIKSTYQEILTDLIKKYSINIDDLSISDKILLLAKSFVIVKFKAGGGDFGNYLFNEINIDDRNINTTRITTIIHELSHFILSEIFEQAIMIILDTDKTDAIEAFVCEILLKDFNYLVDEYCAHTVEGRFTVLGYQNYGSFITKVKNYPENAELTINDACILGNTFSKGIIDIIESYINEDLLEEIKKEYKHCNEQPNYEGLRKETSSCLEKDKIALAINVMINYGINNYNIDKLEVFADGFKKNNSKG